MKSTRESADLKEELARKKAMEEALKKRKEQAEDKAYKKRLLAQIEADRQERKRKQEEEKARRQGRLPQHEAGGSSLSPSQVLAANRPKGSPSDVRLKLMVQGRPVMKRYGPETTLFEVVEDLKKDGTVENVTSFNFKLAGKKFDYLDFGQTLSEAGLAPSAILDVDS